MLHVSYANFFINEPLNFDKKLIIRFCAYRTRQLLIKKKLSHIITNLEVKIQRRICTQRHEVVICSPISLCLRWNWGRGRSLHDLCSDPLFYGDYILYFSSYFLQPHKLPMTAFFIRKSDYKHRSIAIQEKASFAKPICFAKYYTSTFVNHAICT
jgi:hypothetical protein